MNNHPFDDLLRQKASSHEAPVPAGTWEAIAQKKKKRRRYPLFWWITGVALLSGSILLILYKSQSGDNDAGIAIEQTINQQPATNATSKTSGEKVPAGETINPVSEIQLRQEESTPALPEGSATKETGKQTSALLTESVRQDIRINSLSPITARRAATSQALVSNNVEQSRLTDINSDLQETGTTASLHPSAELAAGTSSFLSFNYQPHNKIAESDRRKQLITDAASINKFIRSVADSMQDRVTAMIARAAKNPLKKNKWAVDISVMPFLPVQQNQALSYLTRTNTETMYRSEFKSDRIYTRLQPSVAYTIAIHKKINPRLRIGAGLQYALIKEKVDLVGKETRTTYTEIQRLENGSGGPQLVKDTTEVTSSGTLTIDALNSYRFLSIPVFVQYSLMEKRSWSLQVNGGVLVNISAKYHNSIQGKLDRYDNQGVHTGQQGNDIAFDLFTGLRLSKNYRAFKVFAEPVVRYNIRRYDLSNMINRKFMHQAGLSFGVTYTFLH